MREEQYINDARQFGFKTTQDLAAYRIRLKKALNRRNIFYDPDWNTQTLVDCLGEDA